MKKTLITLILMLTFFCSFTARANEPPLDIGWNIENGILTVNGNGAMPDYANPEDVPWYKNRNEITKIIVEDGITHIGNLAFYGLTNATEVSIPESAKSIGICAFSYTEGTRTSVSDINADYVFELASDSAVVSEGSEFTVSVDLSADFKDVALIQTIVLFDPAKIAVEESGFFDSKWLETVSGDNLGYISKPMAGIVANNIRIAYLSLSGTSIDEDSALYTKGKTKLTIAKIKCKALCDIEDVNTSCFYLKDSKVSLADGSAPKCGETQLTTVTRLPMPNLTINGKADEDEVSKPSAPVANSDITVLANGNSVNYDTKPYVDENGTIMIPIRHTAEAMGIVISWHDDTRTVFATKESDLCAVQIGQNLVFKNSGNIELCANAKIVNARTVLPLEYFEKAFGFKTDYNKETNTIKITTN